MSLSRIGFVLVVVVTISATAATCVEQPRFSVAIDTPKYIHLTWQHDPATTVTITWETSSSTTDSTVMYGLTSSYGSIATGTTVSTGTSGLIHIVELTNLTPGTVYHYICGDNVGSGGWSPDSTFRTASSGTADFTFIACGDSRQALPYPFGNLNEWNTIVGKMNALNPEFVLFTGDLTYDGTTMQYWDDWFAKWEPMGNHTSLMPAIGNHETSGDTAATIYYSRFALPGNEHYYSFNYSSAHIVSVSTEDDYAPGSAQYLWLKNDLAAAQNDSSHPWKFVEFHKPPYTSSGGGTHSPSTSAQNYLVPLFDMYGVDIVFNGHNHQYDRTYPLKGDANPANPTIVDSNKNNYRDLNGTIYVVTGGAGAPMGFANTHPYYIAKYAREYHFTRVSVFSNGSLYLEAIKNDGTTKIDEFWASKPIAPAVTAHSPSGTNVPVDAQIAVTFSAQMNRGATNGAFQLTPAVAGSISWSNGDTQLVFTPVRNFSYGTMYQVTITSAAEDVYGRPLSAPFSWSFRTENYTIALARGWNLISLPLVFPDKNLATVFSTISGKYNLIKAYNSTQARWLTFEPSRAQALNTLLQVDNTMGLWVYATDSAVLELPGAQPELTKIMLTKGWNLVGYPSNTIMRTVAQVFAGAPAGFIVQSYSSINKYNLMTLRLNDFMKPRSGYWVYVPTDWKWVVEW